jgi:hypothetical protein
MLDRDENYAGVPVRLLEKWRNTILDMHMDRLLGDIVEDIEIELAAVTYQKEEPKDIHKKKEWCHTCKYWDGVGDGGISWSRNGCGYCRHGPPTAGCKNQVSNFPITSEYEWCWQWRKIGDDCYIGGF